MKSRILYQCEVCNREYQKEEAAAACEVSHKIPKTVNHPIYDKNDPKITYPESVNVVFKDGTNARYYRVGK